MPIEEIKRTRNTGGKTPLLVCRHCFDSKVEIPCSGGRTSMKQKKDQAQSQKRKGMDGFVERGRMKARRIRRSNTNCPIARPCRPAVVSNIVKGTGV